MVRGLTTILEVADQYRDRICLVNFEKITHDPEYEVKRITNYLGLDYEPEMISSFTKIDFTGKMGDPNASNYSKVSKEPIEKWKKIMNTSLRKIWIKNYLQYLGKDRLETVGYDTDKILSELYELPNDDMKFIQDMFEMSRDTLKIKLKQLVFKRTANLM